MKNNLCDGQEVKKDNQQEQIDVHTATELFAKLTPATQDAIIDLIKSLLSEK